MGSGDGGTPVDSYLPKSQLYLPGPCSFWQVPLGSGVIPPLKRGQVWSLGPAQEGGLTLPRAKEGGRLPCLGASQLGLGLYPRS